MNTFLKNLFEYNEAVNQSMIGRLLEHEPTLSEKTKVLMSHILRAHEIWNSRVQGAVPPAGPWEPLPLAEYERINREQNKLSVSILDSRPGDEEILYSNTKGESFRNSLTDILFHVINHSGYHRGQINTELKQSGIQPLITDYIFYKRS
ncbi:MAG: damage-inducible protein DinB [Bacteroidetes bacterium]|nr:damage-inducible protein DinB [Bacteroidota bacterium]